MFCSLAFAALSLGCGQDKLAQDGGSDTSSDTDSTPAECLMHGLDLSEGYSGVGVAAVMFPGPNFVEGSCGGGGTDATYLVTSQKTSYYRLSMSADDLGSATFHIHAGDSCHGPELYCATGASHSFEIMLAEGETVTMVVDTQPDLVIPDAGLRYNVSVSWASGPCQEDELHACQETLVQAFESCLATSSCGDTPAVAMCVEELRDGRSTCADQFCPDGPYDTPSDCTTVCNERGTSCENDDGCDTNTCAYEMQMCLDGCGVCNAAYFGFAYTGGCELALPGPPGQFHAPFVTLEIAGQHQPLSEPGLACGDPEATDVVWKSDSVLLLCEPACDAFAIGGHAEVAYGTPPCD